MIYLVTNKITHARACVVAKSESEAISIRPDSDSTNNVHWKNDRWTLVGSYPHEDRPAQRLPCWPDDPALIHAQDLGRASRDFEGTTQVLVFEADEKTRLPGEGPDETWGVDEDEENARQYAELDRSLT